MRRAKRLREIRARLAAAPSSPWYVYVEDAKGPRFRISNFDADSILHFRGQEADPAAVDLLTNAPGDLEFLLAEVERLSTPRWFRRRVESSNE